MGVELEEVPEKERNERKMRNEQKQLLNIIQCAFGNKKYLGNIQEISDEEKEKIARYAEKQGLFPFLQYAPAFMEGEWKNRIFKQLVKACYIDSVQMAELNTILDAFEENGIYCIPLKGSKTKVLYPKSELRTMGDLDLLYKPEQSKEMKGVMETLGYQDDGESQKHDHYQKADVLVEMHKTLVAAQSNTFTYFLETWKRALPKEGKNYIHELTLEDHYLFTLCHLIEHFIRGGIGIRMVLDIYVISRQPNFRREYVEKELQKLDIETFEKKIRALADLWFEGKQDEEDLELRELAEYILNGGIFGNRENDRQNNMLMYKSKTAYLKDVIFPSYQTMKTVFPWLRTPVLLPVAWGVRAKNVWTKRRGNIHSQMERAKAWEKKDEEESARRKRFFEKCGL